MKKILITLLVCTGLFSCSKDDDKINSNNESYKPDGTIISEPAVMYTKDGISHDQTVIKGYLTRRGRLSAYALDQSVPSASAFSSYTLEFTGDKSVLMGNVKGEIISKNDTLMMIAAVNVSTEAPRARGVVDTLVDLINKNGPLAECPAYYTAPCPYKKKYPVLITSGHYYIPYVVATVSTNVLQPTMFGVPADYTYFSYEDGQSMLFNEEVTKKLGGSLEYVFNNLTYVLDRNDTLIIQKMRQGLTRQ
jgi:hypothetical protein